MASAAGATGVEGQEAVRGHSYSSFPLSPQELWNEVLGTSFL